MEGMDSSRSPRQGGLLSSKNRGRIKVFVICLLISTFIWFTRALSENYESQQGVPVVLSGLRTDFTVGNDIPSHIQLSLESHGFGMIGEAFSGHNDTLFLDLSYVSAPGQYTVGIQKIRQAAAALLGKEVEITSVQPETFAVMVVKKATKRVAVEPLINADADENHFLGRAHTLPDSITVQGSESQILQINSLLTSPINLSGLRRSDTLEAGISFPPGISAEVQSVRVVIPVDEYTEKQFTLPISIPLHPEYTIKTYPDSVNVSFLCGLQEYEMIQSDMFQASVELPEVGKLEDAYKLNVVLNRQPDQISRITLNPARVEFVLLEK